ncbi:MAG: hypothetical protein AMXMBFR13_34550 [Phycisphaerae bacterium]
MSVSFDEALANIGHEKAEHLAALENELVGVARRVHAGTADASDAQTVADYADAARVPLAAARAKVDEMVAVLQRADELTALMDPAVEAEARAERDKLAARLKEINELQMYWRGSKGGNERFRTSTRLNKANRRLHELREAVNQMDRLRAEHPQLFSEDLS